MYNNDRLSPIFSENSDYSVVVFHGFAFCHGLYLPSDVYLPPGDHEMNWDLNDFNISPENFF